MQVKATVLQYGAGVEIPLTEEEQQQLASIFELGVNVGPNEPQTIRVVISTPGYEEKEVSA